MSATAVARILELLAEEEQLLRSLCALARDEQAALIASDYPRIEQLSLQMLELAGAIEAREAERSQRIRTLDPAIQSLDDFVTRAEDLGMTGAAPLRERLLELAHTLRELQEANARLLLNAIRLRDRWAAILGGHLAPTYGAGGEVTIQEGSSFVSRSA